MIKNQNKQNAVAFYNLMFNQCKLEEAVEKYVGHMYIQYNPYVGDGKDAFIKYFVRMAKEYPGKKTEFRKIIAEDNFVVLHCCQHGPNDKDYAGINIFRV